MLEALHVRPELAAFEAAVRERIERLATLEDERFARIRGVERDDATGDLLVVSEFVPGSRLSDLLDVAQEAAQEGITPGVDVALGYLLEALPAISTLHAALGTAHGAIAPARTVLTPAGQVVFLDTAFGDVLERLRFSRARLWKEFGIAMAPSAGSPRFDAVADIGQVALNALMLVLGRPLRAYEYPGSLPSVMREVVEVAQIRGSASFAAGIERFLERSLPLEGGKRYANADEASADVRQMVRKEIGVEVCRRALVEFVVETAEGLAAVPAAGVPASSMIRDAEPAEQPLDVDLDQLAAETIEELFDEIALAVPPPHPPDESDAEQEVVLEPEDDASVYDISVEDQPEVQEFPAVDTAAPEPLHAPPVGEEPVSVDATAPEPVFDEPLPDEVRTPEPEPEQPVYAEPLTIDSVAPQRVPEPDLEPVVAAPAPETAAPEEPLAEVAIPSPSEAVAPKPEAAETAVPEPVAAQPAGPESRRRKRQRSVRSRKDKLRSITAAGPTPAVTSQPRTAPLIAPNRAAAYDAPDDEYNTGMRAPIGFAPPPAPPPVAAAPPPQPSFVQPGFAPAAAPIPMPRFAAPPAAAAYAGPSTTIWSAPPIAADPPVAPPPATSNAPIPIQPPPIPQSAPIRLKSDAAFGNTSRAPRAEPRLPRAESDIYAPAPQFGQRSDDVPREFPWKLAVALLVLVAAAIVAGRLYLHDRREDDAASGTATPVAGETKAPPKTGGASITGTIEVQSQPTGARVLLDGEAVGQTPVTLPAMPGKHVLTLLSSSGAVKRNVRVDAGKTVKVDVPLFSGWVAIFAPVILNVSENGKVIGSTQDGRIMLAPGSHELTLTNRDLGYTSKETVEIVSGEVNSLTIEPHGTVNFNAVPWAEVWIDGKKAGDTPLANQQVPLGVRDVVFKNPEFGERRIVTTVRADAPAAVSVDFTRKP